VFDAISSRATMCPLKNSVRNFKSFPSPLPAVVDYNPHLYMRLPWMPNADT
jgi:hypothetical protein